MRNEMGQSLMELVIVMAVVVMVVGALTFATISSLRNAQFAKNQAQATKLAQEGIERVRAARDRGDNIGGSWIISGNAITSWMDADLWSSYISGNCVPICFFKFSGASLSYLTAAPSIPSSAEDPLEDGKFKRVVTLSDSNASVPDGSGGSTPSYRVQKTVTVIVTWTDFAGNHESHLTTILRRI